MKLIQGTQLPQALEEGFQLCMMQLLPIKGSTPRVSAEDWRYLTLHQEVISDQIGPLLSQYGDLFCEPADCLLAKVSLTTGFHLILKQGPLILDPTDILGNRRIL